MLTRLSIDHEFPSREWWTAGGQTLWEAIAEEGGASSVVVDTSIAESWLIQARAIPGWADGPDYAPHPINVASVTEEEASL